MTREEFYEFLNTWQFEYFLDETYDGISIFIPHEQFAEDKPND